MLDWLNRLQNQPKAQRQQIAFAGAVCVTSVIAVLWFVSLPERLRDSNPTTVVAEEASEPLFDDLFTGVREQVGNVRGAFAQLQESGEATATSSAGTAATSTTPASSAATSSNIVVPTVDAETARRYNARPILIATSSATSS